MVPAVSIVTVFEWGDFYIKVDKPVIFFQVTAPLTHQEALLEQQKLKLKLQQQTLLQQQLEQQLQEYQRQLTNIYGPAGAPGGPSVPGLGTLEQEQEPFSGGAAREGTTSFSDTVSNEACIGGGLFRGIFHWIS